MTSVVIKNTMVPVVWSTEKAKVHLLKTCNNLLTTYGAS